MWVVRAAASPFAPPLPLPAPVPCLVLFALLDALPLLPLPVAGRSLRQREGCVLRGGEGAASVLGTGATAEEGQKRVGRPPFQGAQGRRGGGHGGAARSCDVAGAVYRRCSRTLRRGPCLSARCSRPTTAIRGRRVGRRLARVRFSPFPKWYVARRRVGECVYVLARQARGVASGGGRNVFFTSHFFAKLLGPGGAIDSDGLDALVTRWARKYEAAGGTSAAGAGVMGAEAGGGGR